MTMADRIQSLRKTKGISQEELADQIGVSRQAVSKWESEQSNPDLEKVILLSEYFEVTTDYLLKGIEPKPDSNIKNRHDARLYMLLGTAINFIGLTSALMVWIEQQREYSVAIGLILFAVGCLIYAVGQLFGSNKTAAKKWFIGVNIWILLFIPLNCIFQFIIALIHRLCNTQPTSPILWEFCSIRCIGFWVVLGVLYCGLCIGGCNGLCE